MKRYFFALLIACMLLPSLGRAADKLPRWAVYYGYELAPQEFLDYPLVLFDRHQHPMLDGLVSEKRVLLAYISAGEAEDFRRDFKIIQNNGWMLAANPLWKGHYIIDIRKPEWTKYIIEEMLPMIEHEHFNGIMLDTLDSAIDLENRDPKKFAGMKAAAVSLIKTIRMHYPDLKIMLNRAFDILPEAAPYIDYVLAESTYSDYNEKEKKFFRVPVAENAEITKLLEKTKAEVPKLQVTTLDYWNPKDKNGIKAIYAAQRAKGFTPYVSTLDLQSLTPEP